MTQASMMTDRMDVEKIPDTPSRDSSGGIIDTFSTVYSNVACSRNPEGASRMADFAIAGVKITDVVVTFQTGINTGMRLKFVLGDGVNTIYLRVVLPRYVQGKGTIQAFYALGCEEIRLA